MFSQKYKRAVTAPQKNLDLMLSWPDGFFDLIHVFALFPSTVMMIIGLRAST